VRPTRARARTCELRSSRAMKRGGGR
jgi:hypothetical protein